jgi:MFS family permease
MGLNSLPFGYTLVVLPIYLSDIGVSPEIIGAITSISTLANTITLIPFAVAADRYGRKRLTIFGFVFSALAYVLFAYSRDLNSLLLASTVGGIGLAGGVSGAISTPAWTAWLAEKAPSEKRTQAFANSQGVWTIALTAGSIMSVLPLLLRTSFHATFAVSYEFVFLILMGCAILSGVVLLPIHEETLRSHSERASNRILPTKSRWQIFKFSVTLGLVGFGSGIGFQLIALWFNRVYGVSESALGPWFAAAEITSLVVVPIIPLLTSRVGSPRCVLVTQGLSACLLASMVLAPTYELAAAIFVARNFLMNISWPVQQSYLMGTVASDERASASGITSMVWGIGGSVSPFMAGYLLAASSYELLSAPLIIGGAAYLISAIGFYYFFRGHPLPEEAHGFKEGLKVRVV